MEAKSSAGILFSEHWADVKKKCDCGKKTVYLQEKSLSVWQFAELLCSICSLRFYDDE